MKILVTGASGFIGGSFMRKFADTADIDLFGVGRRPGLMTNYAQVDLSQEFKLSFVPDVIIHSAARASPWGTANEFQRDNVETTRQVIRFCERHGRPKLIYLSSSAVFYRREHQYDLTETSPIGPTFINDYAATKYQGELAVRQYSGPWVIVRPRAVFGPGDTVLFPRILRAARGGQLPLFKPVGMPARGDLIYIDTLCDYLWTVATRSVRCDAYNLTNAEPVVIQEFLWTLLVRLGVPLPRRKLSIRTAMTLARMLEAAYQALPIRGEPAVTQFGVSVFAYSKTFDVSRMLSELGTPSVALSDGVDRFVAWQQAQP